ncbi:MAG: hypothetical protein KJZ60_06255, partial [Ignavibacteriaceae bacterium]|nr:hypothetical protein [Ignavibacteriaceae bacterium]
MLIHTKLFSFILLSTYILAQNSEKQTSLLIGENFRIFPGNASQTEVFSINHPYNPDIIFVSANTIVFSPFFISEGIYVTSNGGNNWYGSDTCKGTPIQLHGGDPGIT